MNIRIFSVVFFSILFSNSYSQDLNKVDVFPVSPQAGSLGKYGDLPVDLCTGKVNYTIPIFTIKEGDFEFPIQLNYNYNGLQVGEMYGHVGAGWSINSSGYISVNTRGGSDFSGFYTSGYIYSNIGKNIVKPYINGDWRLLPNNLSEEKIYNLFSGSASGTLDTESDKYIVNSGNLNFSFYLDVDANPVFYNDYKNYKIELDRYSTLPNFKIADDNGNRYLFGKSETTGLMTPDFTQYDINSAYNLTSIQTSKNGNINFNYFQDVVSQEYYSDELILPTSFSSNGPGDGCSGRQITRNRSDNVITKNNVSEIIYSSGKLIFTYLDNNYQGNRLKDIKIYDRNNKMINHFEFIYNENKKLLIEIKKYDYDSNSIPFYKFEYYDTIPDNISPTSQDLWGYYNASYNDYLVTGNRKVDFNATRFGALKKIIYPTGGFSEIEYEQNTSKSNPYFEDCSNVQFNKTEFVTATAGWGNNYQAESNTKIVYIPYKQMVQVVLRSDAGDQTGCRDSVTTSASADFEGLPAQLGPYNVSVCSPQYSNATISWAECKPGYVDNKTIMLEYGPGHITINATTTETISTTSTSSVSLSYNDFIPNNFPVGGIRVKSIKDYNILDSNFIEKKYKYQEEDGASSGTILYKSVKFFKWGCNNNRYVTYKAKSMLPLDSYNGNPVIYSRVKEETYNGNSSNGSKIYNYSTIAPDLSQIFLDDDRNNNRNGKLISENKLNSGSNAVSTEKYSYSDYNFNNKYTLGFKSIRIMSNIGLNSSSIDISAHFFTNDYLYHYNTYNLVKKETELMNSTGNILNVDNYSYNGFNQLSSQTSKSSIGEIIETKFFYPNDLIAEPFMSDLKTANILSTPIKTESYKSTEKLSEQKTTFAKDATTNNLLLPKTIYAAKFPNSLPTLPNYLGQLEKKITFDLYDNKGNITQYTPEGGIPVAIIWGYNQTQPIAKIENATYAQVQQYEANLQALSNGTDVNSLISSLDALRTNLPDAMVTTYTYIPLVGVSTITDPKGLKTTYEYDSFNRLQWTKDQNGNVLEKYCYNYKGQQINCQ